MHTLYWANTIEYDSNRIAYICHLYYRLALVVPDKLSSMTDPYLVLAMLMHLLVIGINEDSSKAYHIRP